MNLIRKALGWLFTPHKDTSQEELRTPEFDYNQHIQGWMADEHERDRKRSLETIPEQPDLSDDPDTDVPVFHPGQAQHVDLTEPTEYDTDRAIPRAKAAPSHLMDVGPSDWDLLSDDEKALFEQITPHDESKIIKYPAPVEITTADWVTEQLKKAGYSEAYHLRFMAFRRVGVGMSMRHLGDLKRRADARDASLSTHDLIALRTRGIA